MEWRATVEAVRQRARGRCEVATHDHPGRDPDHVVARSRGGSDRRENIIWLCRFHHDMKDWPYSKGRLVIEADGHGGFRWSIVQRADKWAVVAVVVASGYAGSPWAA